MKFLSICSGIEAASVATHDMGWQAVGFSEIEAFPSAVLAHRWPDVPNLGDMTKYNEWPTELQFDLLCGGTPCQGFSVAGLRGGLSDPRSQLSIIFVEIAAKYRPQWLVWENVPGVLSSAGGKDFGTFLETLTGRELPTPPDGWRNSGHVEGIPGAYGIAWRILDAQFAGVPQRRRRVFVIGYLGDWRPAAAVLFERHSLQGNHPPSRETGQGTAGNAQGRSHWSGGPHPSLNQSHNTGGIGMSNQELFSQEGAGLMPEISATVSAKWSKGSGGPAGDECQNLIPTYCIAENIIGKQDHNGGNGAGHQKELSYTLNTVGVPAVAFSCKDHGADAGEISPTLRSMGHNESHANGGGQVAVAFGVGEQPEVGHCLRSAASKADKHESTTYIKQGTAVRRLTPIECERLQGFPDNYTAIPWRGKPADQCPDGPRYKALGNSWAVPCFRWIAQRIELIQSQITNSRQ